ncbi:unnamed protein product [Heterobilharzia americana]|nr:unnamed protein product [Heterobilharzia americana]
MADDSDVDNELEKESVKKGRRAKAAIQNKKEVTCEDGNSQDSFEGKECNGFPGRRIADWNEINVPHGVSFGRRAQTNLQNICDLSQKQESDEELEIPIIPDVCSAEESVVDSKSAVPPNVVINRIPSYRELNQDLINHGTIPVLVRFPTMKFAIALIFNYHYSFLG